MNVIMIPSVAGGIGHISRTAILARALLKLDPTINFEYLLDTERLRPFNVDAAVRTGFRVNLLPSRPRDTRDAIVRTYLGHADVIIEDTQRYLVPIRYIVPQAAWVSIPLYPIGDELFMDWPFMLQMDAIIWAYAPLIGMPPELEIVRDKVFHTGPFLDLDDVPEREAAALQLGFASDEQLVIYAPRGMPFGREFGERVLTAIYCAVDALRARYPRLRLVLLAVNHPDELHASGVPNVLPSWVRVVGVVTPQESLRYMRAAAIAIAEGTSTAHEAAALRLPFVMVPGPIYETGLLGTRLAEHHAAHILRIDQVTPESMTEAFSAILTRPDEQREMLERAHALVTGGGGVTAAARHVLDVVAAYSSCRVVKR